MAIKGKCILIEGGGTATYVTHWLDTVKVKMQTFPDVHKSSISCFKNIFRDEGLRGLYQGASPAVIGHMSKTAIVFMSYGLCEELVRKVTGIRIISLAKIKTLILSVRYFEKNNV